MFGIVSNYTETVNEVSNCMMVDVLNIHLKLLAINLRLKQFGSKSFSSHSQFHESKCMQSDQQIRSDQLLSHVRLFATPWTAARQASLFITNSRRSLRLTSIESVMPSSHLNLCRPLSSWPQSLPKCQLLKETNHKFPFISPDFYYLALEFLVFIALNFLHTNFTIFVLAIHHLPTQLYSINPTRVEIFGHWNI